MAEIQSPNKLWINLRKNSKFMVISLLHQFCEDPMNGFEVMTNKLLANQMPVAKSSEKYKSAVLILWRSKEQFQKLIADNLSANQMAADDWPEKQSQATHFMVASLVYPFF